MPLLGNDELARIFYEIGDMLEIQGELPFKIGAYRRGGRIDRALVRRTCARLPAGTPPRLPGVGKAIDEKLEELADTGRLRYYERLRRDVPPSRRDAAAGARPWPANGRRAVAPGGHRLARRAGGGRAAPGRSASSRA